MQETQGSKRITLLSSKPPSHNKLRLRISNKRNLEMDSDTTENGNKRPSMLGSRKSRYQESEEDFESDLSDEELGSEEMSNDDDECGSAIEEPMMLVQGEGSGHANKCKNIRFPEIGESEIDENGIGEAIEEEVFFVFGNGSGYDCDVGNNDVKATESTTTSSADITPAVTPSKPMFFFGQAGCLKLSPMRTVVSTPPLNERKNDSDNVVPDTDKSNEETSNDSNPIASEANSLSNDGEENAATYDQTDKATTISNQNQESSLNESCESETKNEPTEIEPESSQPNKVDNDLSDVSNESIKYDQVVSEPNDNIETFPESETNNEIINAEKPSQENETEVNRSDESTSCINNSHVNVESNDAVALKSEQVQDNEHESAKNDMESGMNKEILSNSEIGENVESELNKGEPAIFEPVVHNERTMTTEEGESNDQISLSESKIEASSVVEDIVPIDKVETNVSNADNSEPPVSEIETKNETELKRQKELETCPETQPKEDEASAQESPFAASENVVESINETVQEMSKQISGKHGNDPIDSPPQKLTAEKNEGKNDSKNMKQVDVRQQKADIPDPLLEEKPSYNETDRRDDSDQSPIPSESVTSEIDETLQTEDSLKDSDSVDLKAIESCIIPNSEPEKEALETPNEILDQVSNEPTSSVLTISQEINKKELPSAEVTPAECSGLNKEKRKSIDQIEESVICKRVYICGENDLDEFMPEPSSIQIETVTKPNEIPQTVLPVSETLPTVKPVSLEEPIVRNELVATVINVENDQNQSEILRQSVSSQDVIEINERKPDDSSQITQSIPDIVEEKIESIAVPTVNKSKLVPKSASPSPKAAQSRTRKRRISGEKPRHSSESEVESPLSQDQSSDEVVGGKRIKMRAKVAQKSVRKSIEHKRNVKNADWSSDDNEKPNAKRATSDVMKQTESSVSDGKKESQPVKEEPIKDEPVKEEPEHHSDEQQGNH